MNHPERVNSERRPGVCWLKAVNWPWAAVVGILVGMVVGLVVLASRPS